LDQSENDEIAQIKRGLSWVRLKESLNMNGCPICNTMLKSIDKYFDFLLYEYALDASVHKKMLASFGMCNAHTYLLKEAEAKLKSDGLNIAVLYETILQKEIKFLTVSQETKLKESKKHFFISNKTHDFISYKNDILTKLNRIGICPGCQQQKLSESFYTHELLKLSMDEEFRNKYEHENILLCRMHFLFLINEMENNDTIGYFINVQRKKIIRLLELLSGFIMKHDYRLKNEMKEDEKISWEKALEYFGSMKNIKRDGYNDLLIQ
jgi:hypothetical protein